MKSFVAAVFQIAANGALDDGRDDDEEMFAAVARLSELGAHAYETLVSPLLRATVNERTARLMFATRPLRVERAAFADGRARGYLRRSRLERELALFHDEEPWRSMDETHRAQMIHAQSLVVQFAPERAKSTLPRRLDTGPKRARALDVVMRIVGPPATMHPQALARYRELEAMLAGAPSDGATTPADAGAAPERRSA